MSHDTPGGPQTPTGRRAAPPQPDRSGTDAVRPPADRSGDAEVREAANRVYEWLREPDWSGDEFSFVEWANTRPCNEAKLVSEALRPAEPKAEPPLSSDERRLAMEALDEQDYVAAYAKYPSNTVWAFRDAFYAGVKHARVRDQLTAGAIQGGGKLDPTEDRERRETAERQLPFEISRWLTTIAAHCVAIRDGDNVHDVACCIDGNLADLAETLVAALSRAHPTPVAAGRSDGQRNIVAQTIARFPYDHDECGGIVLGPVTCERLADAILANITGAAEVERLTREPGERSGLRTTAEDEARSLAERAGIDMLDDHDQFIADLAATLERFADAQLAEKDATIAGLMFRFDAQLGTPCEQIRHAQEVEELKDKLATLERDQAARGAVKVTDEHVKFANRAVSTFMLQGLEDEFQDGATIDMHGKPFNLDDICRTAIEAAFLLCRSTDELSAASRDLLAERKRQIEVEGWTPEHDDQHSGGQIAYAASAYAYRAFYGEEGGPGPQGSLPPMMWPWARKWWKPTKRRQMLVKAGALILAEIERLDRQALQAGGRSDG